MGWSHVIAVGGIVVEVVVWSPLTHTHFMVSPTNAFRLFGLKEKFCTLIILVVAKDQLLKRKAKNRKKVVFFINLILDLRYIVLF